MCIVASTCKLVLVFFKFWYILISNSYFELSVATDTPTTVILY